MLAAAANASSHASTSALTTVKATSPNASPFAQLLRSSRFATYDPQIRQTYYSPKQFVERGYWGLKRPIAQRKKNSFITVKQWETRQHYVEWDNAEDQVRFVRRVEELNVRPGARESVKWIKQLGPAKSHWLLDSEFSPHAWTKSEKGKEGEEAMKPFEQDVLPDMLQPPPQIPVRGLGGRGSGRYGANATRNVTVVPAVSGEGKSQQYTRSPTGVIPNVMSMSPAAFERYLEKLRRIRPAFKQYLARVEARQRQDNEMRDLQAQKTPNKAVAHSLEPQIGGKTLLQVAQITDAPFPSLFIADHTESEYRSTTRIQPQPHRNGALMYSHPTMVDSLFHNRPKPGIILEVGSSGRFAEEEDPGYITAYAGFAAVLEAQEVIDKSKTPLLNPGVDVTNWPTSVAEMRPITRSPLRIKQVPRVVGRNPDEGLRGVSMDLMITMKDGFDDPRRKNPYVPGSREYVALEGLDNARPGASRGSTAPALAANPPMESLKNPAMRVPTLTSSPSYTQVVYSQTDEQKQNSQRTLDLLHDLVGTTHKDKKVPDNDL